MKAIGCPRIRHSSFCLSCLILLLSPLLHAQTSESASTVPQPTTLEEAAALCKQRSRNYAKRQLTWFRRNPDIRWLRLTGAEDFSEVLSAARQNVPFSAL